MDRAAGEAEVCSLGAGTPCRGDTSIQGSDRDGGENRILVKTGEWRRTRTNGCNGMSPGSENSVR